MMLCQPWANWRARSAIDNGRRVGIVSQYYPTLRDEETVKTDSLALRRPRRSPFGRTAVLIHNRSSAPWSRSTCRS
jgi:hypothetical protein